MVSVFVPCVKVFLLLILANGESLHVSFNHLMEDSAVLAYLLSNCPLPVLSIFDAVAFEVVLSGFEEYLNIKGEVITKFISRFMFVSLICLKPKHYVI